MGFLLYLLISGDILFIGLAFVVVGVVATVWRPVFGAVLTRCGLILTLVSAVPIHPFTYAILLLTGAGWEFTRKVTTQVRHGLTTALLLAVFAVLGVALTDRSGSGLDLPKDRPVFVIGDSISAGLGASKSGTWPELLATNLNLNVSNLAQAGATLASGASQARSISREPAIVIVELGGNDLLGDTSPESFSRDLRSLLATLNARERRVVMFELPLLPFQNTYGRIQRAVCGEYGVDLLPRSFLAGAVALPGHADDGLHLSAQGHAWLAERVGQLWSGA